MDDQGVRLPLRVAAANDYELIVAGVATMLGAFPEHLMVCDRIVMGDPIDGGPLDVVLYDTYGRVGIAAENLSYLAKHPDVRHVAMFSMALGTQMIADGRDAGATGFISKALDAEEICDAIIRVAHGEEVIAVDVSATPALDQLDWPGKDDGLSERESQVIVLLAEGLSNAEIGTSLYLSLETVKSHVKQILAKLHLRNRVQAAAYVGRSGAFSRYQPARPDLVDRERPS